MEATNTHQLSTGLRMILESVVATSDVADSTSSVTSPDTSSITRLSTFPENDHRGALDVVAILQDQIAKLPVDLATVRVKRLVDAVADAAQSHSKSKGEQHQKTRKNLDKAISKWNKGVTHLRQSDERAAHLPTVNTKPHKHHGLVQAKIDAGYDSFMPADDSDGAPIVKSLSLCSHGVHTHTPCLLVLPDTLNGLINGYWQDTDRWSTNLFSSDIFGLSTVQIVKALEFKCPALRTAACAHATHTSLDASRLCDAPISLRKILQFMDHETRKLFTRERLLELLVRVYAQKTQSTVSYCTSPTCQYSHIGIPVKIAVSAEQLHGTIHCTSCNGWHAVHAHKVKCPCGITFCAVCRLTPYHIDAVCQGYRTEADLGMNDQTFREFQILHRRCPGCRSYTEKTDGCDHMTCSCNTHWCWRCQQRLDPADPYAHQCLGAEVAGEADDHYTPDVPRPVGGW
ncbi:IBR domain-containing protein [Fadolivirus algeromassiliense]|jgi:hypothetical protein|uniref:RBR-type E3 ubiquitin transferase n=1 Tax=Fadolivirus FV1/VV64 TaxID=3070911 RepID=A0A7D3QUZ2_9VIRU|nr:IBR domain-containing protein [Fadolivirus algeromassiliense]QKF93506.1 IBR domain-containing protein [Fadolivirus FV1/VV64]